MSVNPITTAIPLPYDAIAEFCEKHHIKRMWVFGSVLRDDFDNESDVDVLVEFDPAHIPGLAYFGMGDELSEIIGRHIDFGTPGGLRSWLRDGIMRSAQVIYEHP